MYSIDKKWVFFSREWLHIRSTYVNIWSPSKLHWNQNYQIRTLCDKYTHATQKSIVIDKKKRKTVGVRVWRFGCWKLTNWLTTKQHYHRGKIRKLTKIHRVNYLLLNSSCVLIAQSTRHCSKSEQERKKQRHFFVSRPNLINGTQKKCQIARENEKNKRQKKSAVRSEIHDFLCTYFLFVIIVIGNFRLFLFIERGLISVR